MLQRLLALAFALLVFVPARSTAQDTTAVTLRPGDLIRLTIYREPDLNGEFLVDEAGTVNLPLVGDMPVTGVPLQELRTRMVEAYRVHLRNPSINVVPLRRVHVLGEVQKPGLYAIDPTMSLTGAIGMAGGATPAGDLRKIRLVRDGTVAMEGIGEGRTTTRVGLRSGDEIYVLRRSWFDRNSTFVVTAMLSLASIASSIIVAASRN